ncbi:MAG: ABC transporter permease [Halohasta sp.]
MSWLVVARKDFEDSIRSRWLIGLTVLFVLLLAIISYIVRGEGSANQVLQLASEVFTRTLVPLIALVVAYNAITGEQKSGSLKLLLSLPHSRADVVFGKVAGRAAALSTAIIVGFVLPAIVLAIGPFTLELGAYLGYTLLVALLASAFVAIAVGWSAAAPSQRIALGGAIGLYFLFGPFWGAIQLRLQMALSSLPEWVPLSSETIGNALFVANPVESFRGLTGALLAEEFLSGSSADIQLAALAMMLVWILGAPLAGYAVFERRDL